MLPQGSIRPAPADRFRASGTAGRSAPGTPRRGFTLMESALAIVIIGTGVFAMLRLLSAGTSSNQAGAELTTAVNLANNVHEIIIRLPFYDPDTAQGATPAWNTKEADVTQYDDVLDFDACTFSPPIDVRRQPISLYAGWSQVVSVSSVSLNQLSSTQTNSTAIPTARVTVQVFHAGRLIYQTNWLTTAPVPD